MSALTKYNLTFIIFQLKKKQTKQAKKKNTKQPHIEKLKTAQAMFYSTAPSSS